MALQLHLPRWLKPTAPVVELACPLRWSCSSICPLAAGGDASIPPAQDAWFEVAVVRSTLTRDIVGGVSGLFKKLVHLFIGPGADHNMETAGVVVGRPGRAMHIFASVRALVADEGALHAIFACKGAGGLKPCLLCTNVYAHGGGGRDVVARDASGVSVSHTCTDSSQLKLHTCATVAAVLRALANIAAQPKSKGKLEELETCLGWRHDPGALLADEWLLPRIHPGATCIFDWMHVIFVNGVYATTWGQFAWHCMGRDGWKHRGLSYEAMHEAVQSFAWPKLVGAGPCNETFSPKRAGTHWEGATFKASASEGLSAMPFMLYFVQGAAALINDAELTRHVSCFASLCCIVQSLHGAPFQGVDTTALQRQINAFLAEFKHLYGEGLMVPKFH